MELGTLKEAEAGECLVEVSCMKTIQDKLRTRITTIRTLRDSLFLIASRKGHTHTHEQVQAQHMRDFGFLHT